MEYDQEDQIFGDGSMSSSIPEARRELYLIADRLMRSGETGAAADIRRIVDTMMRRDRIKKPAKRTARSMTPTLASQIYEYHTQYPDLSNRAIGAHFGVDGARVSEVITGTKWLPEQQELARFESSGR